METLGLGVNGLPERLGGVVGLESVENGKTKVYLLFLQFGNRFARGLSQGQSQ